MLVGCVFELFGGQLCGFVLDVDVIFCEVWQFVYVVWCGELDVVVVVVVGVGFDFGFGEFGQVGIVFVVVLIDL